MKLFSSKKDKKIVQLTLENLNLKERIRQLEELCEEKDLHFKEMISDGMRKGSSLAAKHMADRKNFLNRKK